MARLVDRWGRTGFALASSLIWFLPMAAWAGSVDLQPGRGPWIAFAVGLLMLIVWIGFQVWARSLRVTRRARRFDLASMSGAERAWLLGVLLCGSVVVGWLMAAATVDWGLLRPGINTYAFLAVLLVVLVAAVAGTVLCWRRAAALFAVRRASP